MRITAVNKLSPRRMHTDSYAASQRKSGAGDALISVPLNRTERRNGMQERRYVLDIGQMLEGGGRDALFREAFGRIDMQRRQKALPVKNVRAQAAGIGAGLLIQKALSDYMPDCLAGPQTEQHMGCLAEPHMGQSTGRQEGQGNSRAAEKPVLECFSVRELLSVLGRKVAEPYYRYGENGKPYLADYPFQFNLSHSGDYVFCGVSEREIGVDIQKIQGDQGLRLAKRFFTDLEYQALEACGDEELRRRMFFCMWTRKEAYGKLTGEGIAGAVGKCFWRNVPAGGELSADSLGEGFWWEDDLVWEEYDVPNGYRTVACRFR